MMRDNEIEENYDLAHTTIDVLQIIRWWEKICLTNKVEIELLLNKFTLKLEWPVNSNHTLDMCAKIS